MQKPSSLVLLIVILGLVIPALIGIIVIQFTNRSPAGSDLFADKAPGTMVDLAYTPVAIGAPAGDFGRPMVTNLQIVDLDQDGLLDVIYCEGVQNSVRWIRQMPRGVFTETIVGERIPGPAHVWAGDVYGNGRLDILVASMGQISPNNDRIGAVIALENEGAEVFTKRVLLRQTARVTDVRGANLMGHADGRLDLVVGQFGYAQGEVRWMENKGNWNFGHHLVSTLSGCVHTPVADFDQDGQPDFAALISQEWEEVHLFENEGNGAFASSIVWGSTNEDFGSSGLETADVNRDGHMDLIYTNGDAFDYAGFGSRSWHGVQWLENTGEGDFIYRRIGDMPGAYGPCAADLNADGAIDLVTVSCFADWSSPRAVSMMAWINDGEEAFTPVILARTPTHLITAAVGDLDGNGIPVIVTGGFHAYPPYENMTNITLWRRD